MVSRPAGFALENVPPAIGSSVAPPPPEPPPAPDVAAPPSGGNGVTLTEKV